MLMISCVQIHAQRRHLYTRRSVVLLLSFEYMKMTFVHLHFVCSCARLTMPPGRLMSADVRGTSCACAFTSNSASCPCSPCSRRLFLTNSNPNICSPLVYQIYVLLMICWCCLRSSLLFWVDCSTTPSPATPETSSSTSSLDGECLHRRTPSRSPGRS